MPIYKNTSDKDISGIIGVGLIPAGRMKITADPIEHPALEEISEQEYTATLQGTKQPRAACPYRISA